MDRAEYERLSVKTRQRIRMEFKYYRDSLRRAMLRIKERVERRKKLTSGELDFLSNYPRLYVEIKCMGLKLLMQLEMKKMAQAHNRLLSIIY
jgi:hypothetical protein